ncbi:hypothetical protein ACFLZC_02880 [Patescibacteria group bacterium]
MKKKKKKTINVATLALGARKFAQEKLPWLFGPEELPKKPESRTKRKKGTFLSR